MTNRPVTYRPVTYRPVTYRPVTKRSSRRLAPDLAVALFTVVAVGAPRRAQAHHVVVDPVPPNDPEPLREPARPFGNGVGHRVEFAGVYGALFTGAFVHAPGGALRYSFGAVRILYDHTLAFGGDAMFLYPTAIHSAEPWRGALQATAGYRVGCGGVLVIEPRVGFGAMIAAGGSNGVTPSLLTTVGLRLHVGRIAWFVFGLDLGVSIPFNALAPGGMLLTSAGLQFG